METTTPNPMPEVHIGLKEVFDVVKAVAYQLPARGYRGDHFQGGAAAMLDAALEPIEVI